MLHSPHALVSFFLNVLKNIFIIDLSTSRLLPTRIVANLEIGDFSPALIDVSDQIAFISLHVIDVEKNFAGRTIDGFAEGKSLIREAHEKIWIVAQWL